MVAKGTGGITMPVKAEEIIAVEPSIEIRSVITLDVDLITDGYTVDLMPTIQ